MKQDLSYLNKIFSKKTLFQLIQKTKTTEELNLKLNELYKEYQLLAKYYRNEYFFTENGKKPEINIDECWKDF